MLAYSMAPLASKLVQVRTHCAHGRDDSTVAGVLSGAQRRGIERDSRTATTARGSPGFLAPGCPLSTQSSRRRAGCYSAFVRGAAEGQALRTRARPLPERTDNRS